MPTAVGLFGAVGCFYLGEFRVEFAFEFIGRVLG